jgi:DNA-binding Xre family transcriptional regulator
VGVVARARGRVVAAPDGRGAPGAVDDPGLSGHAAAVHRVPSGRQVRLGGGVRGGVRPGAAPVAVCHEWNTIAHLNDYEGSPEARPFTREELQRFLDYADDQVERAARSKRKGALAAYRDATIFKVIYGWGLRRTETARLVTERPERLSLKILMALLDILDCTMDDLIEPVAAAGTARRTGKAAAGGAGDAPGTGALRPRRARIAGTGQ